MSVRDSIPDDPTVASARHDFAAAMEFVTARGLPHPWVLGWSFGTEVALKYGLDHDVEGVILLSPPLHRTTPEEVAAWAGDSRRVVVIVPELDDYLRPDAAAERFASVPDAVLIAVEGGKHLWVGENQTRRVLTEIVAAVNPEALLSRGKNSPLLGRTLGGRVLLTVADGRIAYEADEA